MFSGGNKDQDRYDELIKHHADANGLDWIFVKRQILVESEGRPSAVSPEGAMGLMQFMPNTWREWGQGNPHEPEANIMAGVKYMSFLVSKFDEIPDELERYKFALASFNAGRHNINQCLEYARQATGAPGDYEVWVNAGRPPGPWQEWRVASQFLHMVTGRFADITLRYVAKIMGEE